MRMWVLRASNSSAWQIRSPPYSHTLYNRRSMTSRGNHLQFLSFFLHNHNDAFFRPRSQDNVYINENFDDDIPTYDTPRKKQDYKEEDEEEDELDCIECEYDIPKVREAVLTPIEEEEAAEYDVPRNNRTVRSQLTDSEENLYENQHFDSRHPTIIEEPIYMNEMNDGGSSGYRSSSSPSIHSEENLYENRAVALSLEEISLRGSQVRKFTGG